MSENHKSENVTRSVSADTSHQSSGYNHLAFGDPQVTILSSPGIIIFEACTSAIEISYALVDRYPKAADKVQASIAITLIVTGLLMDI